MKNDSKHIAEMYGILIRLREDYDKIEKKLSFKEYAKIEVLKLLEEGMEWIEEDEYLYN